MTDDQLLQAAVDSLGRAFEQDPGVIRRTLSAYQVVNWVTDPFSLGAYSYEVVNGATYRRELQAPVNDTLFFGGEALHEGPHIGTVEGALASGLEQAGQILEAFGRNNG
jgi:monoamine oxidase